MFFKIIGETFYKDFYEKYDDTILDISPAYIASFVKVDSENEPDKLFLWRTYGKHENEEAAGACLILSRDQFADENPPANW